MIEPKATYSLAELLASPSGRMFLEESAIDSADALADYCEREIHRIFQIMEENPQNHREKSEDEITHYIVDMLRSKGILAEHDMMHGGHADIIIRHKTFKWLAEAKIFETGSYKWLIKGFLQLTSRYMAARDMRAALLIYTFQENSLRILEKWKISMSGYRRILAVIDCNYCPLSFYTTSKNNRSGLTIKVRHTVLTLYFYPEA